jgi:folate-binding protein YgfZ
LKASGEDRARLLHAMCTNNILALQPEYGCYAFFLTAQGRILADAHILCREDHFLIGTEPSTRRSLFEHLDRFIIADDVTLEDISTSTACIQIEGPQAEGHLRSLGTPVPEDAGCSAIWGPRLIYKLDEDRFRIITHLADVEELTARLGDQADAEAAETVRLERAIPRYGVDILDKHLVQETRQMHAVHFAKGCYLGQEIVERVRSRGAVHKGLAPVTIEGEAALEPGTAIHDAEGAKCGDLMSNIFSPALGSVAGFAMVRADQLTGTPKPMMIGDRPVRLR